MSIELMTQVLNSNVEGHVRRTVLLVLANNANSEGLCWPSITTVANQLDLHERTVQRCIRELEDQGIITSRRRAGRSTVFVINREKISPRQPKESLGTTRSDAPIDPRQSATPGGGIQPPPAQRHPRQSVTPQEKSPPAHDHPGGGAQYLDPRHTTTQNLKRTSIEPKPLPPSAGDKRAEVLEGEIVDDNPTAQKIIAGWIDRCAKRPPGETIKRTGQTIKKMLGEGIDARDIVRGIEAWMEKGYGPSALPGYVNQVMNGTPGSGRSTTNDRVSQGMAISEKFRKMEEDGLL